MTTDWLLRVGDGMNFINSSKYHIWGINATTDKLCKHFVENVRPGDRMWFVTKGSGGKIIAVATYRSHNRRNLGPLVAVSMTDEELGWSGKGLEKINVEIHYTDLYNLTDCHMLTHIKDRSTIIKYDRKICIELPVEYSYIVRYGRMQFEM